MHFNRNEMTKNNIGDNLKTHMFITCLYHYILKDHL